MKWKYTPNTHSQRPEGQGVSSYPRWGKAEQTFIDVSTFAKTSAEKKPEEKPDYSKRSDDELLDTFKTENWKKLNEDHRIAVLQEMENRMAKSEGRIPATVHPNIDSDSFGRYSSSTNDMYVRVSSDCSSYQSLQTFFHESNHAYQHHCVQQNQPEAVKVLSPTPGPHYKFPDYVGRFDQHTLSTMEAEFAPGNYIGGKEDRDGYISQICELDSNYASAYRLMGMCERYKDDPDYLKQLRTCKERYAIISAALTNNAEKLAQTHSDQVNKARAQGVLTDERADKLLTVINDPAYQRDIQKQADDTLKQLDAMCTAVSEYQNPSPSIDELLNGDDDVYINSTGADAYEGASEAETAEAGTAAPTYVNPMENPVGSPNVDTETTFPQYTTPAASEPVTEETAEAGAAAPTHVNPMENPVGSPNVDTEMTFPQYTTPAASEPVTEETAEAETTVETAAPTAETPETETAETEATIDYTGAETEAPETKTAETEATIDYTGAETEAPETETAETEATIDYTGAETEAPEAETAETEATIDYTGAETEAPETETAETEETIDYTGAETEGPETETAETEATIDYTGAETESPETETAGTEATIDYTGGSESASVDTGAASEASTSYSNNASQEM